MWEHRGGLGSIFELLFSGSRFIKRRMFWESNPQNGENLWKRTGQRGKRKGDRLTGVGFWI